jgi:cell volume regulation protein A
VLTVSFVLLCYGLSTALGGNGFLAIYLAGLMIGRSDFIHKNSLSQFHDGLAWLMQIGMFIILGLQVFPSRLLSAAGMEIVLALFLIFLARPLSVFVALLPTRVTLKERLFVSWVGLRGAAPIILATFSQIAAIRLPLPIFELVFFVVLVSVLLQGTTIVPVARWLGLYDDRQVPASLIAQIKQGSRINDHLFEVILPHNSAVVGQQIIDLHLSSGVLIVLINRSGEIIVPQGSTMLAAHDQLLVLAPRTEQASIQAQLTAAPPLL